jgi:hypothetical protein
MGSHGSEYGWIFPESMSEEEVILDFQGALAGCGWTLAGGKYGALSFRDESGDLRHFRFLTRGLNDTWTCRVAYTSWGVVQFRPFDLDSRPEYYEITQREYDLAKRVFDLSSATECFGFHASQDNAVVFEDSNLDFFFLKTGPQLALAHLDEHRPLLPNEWSFTTVEEYEFFLDWDEKLHSELFTRFSPGNKDRIYNYANRLIETSWRVYYGLL